MPGVGPCLIVKAKFPPAHSTTHFSLRAAPLLEKTFGKLLSDHEIGLRSFICAVMFGFFSCFAAPLQGVDFILVPPIDRVQMLWGGGLEGGDL